MLANQSKNTTIISVFVAFLLAVAITFCGWNQAIASPLVGSQEEMGLWETIKMPSSQKNMMQSVHTILFPMGK
jgi:hypothetical protein